MDEIVKKEYKIDFSNEEKKIIKTQFFPQGTSDTDMIFCMNIAKNLGLNPILNEIYFVERQSNVNGQWIKKISPLVGRDAFLKLAHSSGVFAGMETTSALEMIPTLTDGKWTNMEDLVATCTVYRKDTEKAFISKVAFSEYAQRTKAGVLTKFWKTKSITMIQKVAESQCLRKAFNISGAYAEEEIEITPPNQTLKDNTNNTTLNLNNIVKEASGEVIEEETNVELTNEIVTEVIV